MWTEAFFDLTEAVTLEPADTGIKSKLSEAREALQAAKEEFYFSYNTTVEPVYEGLKAQQPCYLRVLDMPLEEVKRMEDMHGDGFIIEEIVEDDTLGNRTAQPPTASQDDDNPTWCDEDDEVPVEVALPGRALWLWQSFLKDLRTLLSLTINVRLGTEGCKLIAEALRNVQQLETLRLMGCGARWQGAEAMANALAQNTSLLTLDFSYNMLGARGVKALVTNGLTENERLTRLSLAGNHIGKKGIEAISSLLSTQGATRGAVVELDLSHNLLDYKDMRTLAPALRQDSTMQILDLSCNDLRSDMVYRLGVSAFAHSEMLVLDVRGHNVAKSTMKRLEEKGRFKRCQVKYGKKDEYHNSGPQTLGTFPSLAKIY